MIMEIFQKIGQKQKSCILQPIKKNVPTLKFPHHPQARRVNEARKRIDVSLQCLSIIYRGHTANTN